MLTEKNAKAFAHYHKAQLKWRGMEPWKKFIEEMKIQYCEADQLREKLLVRQVWLRWHKATLEREKERDIIASTHYKQSLLRRSLTAWIKVCKSLFLPSKKQMYSYTDEGDGLRVRSIGRTSTSKVPTATDLPWMVTHSEAGETGRLGEDGKGQKVQGKVQ